MKNIQLATKSEIDMGRHGRPVRIILLICELLVNGTPPYAVAANIQTMSATMNGREVN